MTAPEQVPDDERSNHTIDAFRSLLSQIGDDARTALDVGCGEGFAARELARRGLDVLAVDLDETSLEAARAQDTTGIEYRRADFLADERLTRAAGTFDVVTALAVLHHVDLEAGLTRCREMLSPGGTLLVVGLAASTGPRDVGWDFASVAAQTWSRLMGHRVWEHPSPTVWPPPTTYAQVRETAERMLPGAEFRRRVKWRYTLVWRKPGAADAA